jgi:hypothetical protein
MASSRRSTNRPRPEGTKQVAALKAQLRQEVAARERAELARIEVEKGHREALGLGGRTPCCRSASAATRSAARRTGTT